MPVAGTKQDARFFSIVEGLEWKLDDGGGGPPPPEAPEFYRGGGGGVWPQWSTHLVAFLLGGLTWGALLLAPPALPVLVLAGVIGLTGLAVRRRWR